MKHLAKFLTIPILAGSMGLFAEDRLSETVIAGDLEFVKACVEFWKMDVNGFDKWGWTALMWAVYYQKAPITKYLLDRGADPNLRSTRAYGSMRKGSRAIMMAAYYNQLALVELLLKAGANPTLADIEGTTALDYAKKFEFTRITEVLEKWCIQHPK